MFPKNINILDHCVYPKTENDFDLIVTFPNDQSEADKIHKICLFLGSGTERLNKKFITVQVLAFSRKSYNRTF